MAPLATSMVPLSLLCNDSDLHKSILTGCVTQLVSAKNGGSHSPDLVCISWLLKSFGFSCTLAEVMQIVWLMLIDGCAMSKVCDYCVLVANL